MSVNELNEEQGTSHSHDQENNSVKIFPFQTAGSVISQLMKRCSEIVENDQGSDRNVDFNIDDIPFSEEQLEEFGGRSSIMIGFQSAKQYQNEPFNTNSIALPNNQVELEQSSENNIPSSTEKFEEPREVLEDINKILSKYDDSNITKGPKKKVVFSRKSNLRSKGDLNGASSETSNVNSSSPIAKSCPNNENSSNEKPGPANTKDINKRKITFGRNLRSRDPLILNSNEIADETRNAENTADAKNERVQSDSDEKKDTRKKVVFTKPRKEVKKKITRLDEGEDFSTETDNEDFDSNTHTDDDFTLNKSVIKRKVVFEKRNRRYPKKSDSSNDSDVIFKVPDTEEYLKVKSKTRRPIEKPTQSNETSPKKIVFKPSKNTKKTGNCQTKSTKTITGPGIKSGNSVGAGVTVNRSSENVPKNQPRGKAAPVTSTTTLDAKKELSDANAKSVYEVLYKENEKNLGRQLLAPSAVSEAEDFGDFNNETLLHKHKTIRIVKETEAPLGPPIKVPKRLPDVVSACTRVGQKLLVNLNETRPLLFQTKAAADYWDAATFTNFIRMKHQLEYGEYVHPEMSTTIEEEFQVYLNGLEADVDSFASLCQWEEDLVRTSGNILQWLDDCLDMSPCAMSELSRCFDHLLNIPVSLVMMKKTVYLAELYWNMCELSKGIWSRILSQKSRDVLKHFQENLQLSHLFSRNHYQAALYDLAADFRNSLAVLPYCRRIMFTHSLEEELSWPRIEMETTLNTRPQDTENTLDDYEFTENDHKNVFMLKLLLIFPNQISKPIFLLRNRTLKRKHIQHSAGWNTVSNDESTTSIAEQGEEYEYYDTWNFKAKPKRINRSVKKTKVDSRKKANVPKDDKYHAQLDTFEKINTPSESFEVSSKYNKIDTFNYEDKEPNSEGFNMSNAVDISRNEDVLIVTETFDKLLENIKKEPVDELNETRQMDNSIDMDFNEIPTNVETTSMSTKINEIFVDTLRILGGETDDTMESDVYIPQNECSYYENIGELNTDQYAANTGESNLEFNSQEMKLIYNILDTQTTKQTMDENNNNPEDINNNMGSVLDRNLNLAQNQQKIERCNNSFDQIVPDIDIERIYQLGDQIVPICPPYSWK
ncbi:hypothetical protein M8J76_007827 [Diaphorina citri]|nr:hypothetical protein M8J76_007827 [Diaphorina citri]